MKQNLDAMLATKTRSHMSQKFVDDRRKDESTVNHLGSYLKNNQIASHVANWEVNGKAAQKAKFQKQRVQELKQEFERKTDERRMRLKALYDTEEDQFAKEMRGLRLTPEQIKQSMIDKVNQLKAQREAHRVVEVEEKLDRRFKDQADELRLVNTQIREVKTKHEQDIQMLEKHKKMEEQYVEDMIYAELWRRDVGFLLLRWKRRNSLKSLRFKKASERMLLEMLFSVNRSKTLKPRKSRTRIFWMMSEECSNNSGLRNLTAKKNNSLKN